MNSNIKKQKKSMSLTGWIFYSVVVVVFTLCGKAYVTYSTTLESKWAEYQSPYDIHDEFILDKLLLIHRPHVHVIAFGLLDDWLANKHRQLVEKVKNTLPSDDDAWIEFWYDSEAKFWSYSSKNDSSEIIKTAMHYMDILLNGNSKVKKFDKAWRYKIWSELAYYAATYEFNSSNNYQTKLALINELIKKFETIDKKLDKDYLLSQKTTEVIVPYKILSVKDSLYRYTIEIGVESDTIHCDDKTLEEYNKNVADILKLAEGYNNIISDLPKAVQRSLVKIVDDDNKAIVTRYNKINLNCYGRKL